MKIWLTEFTHDDEIFDGPRIHAHTQEDAEQVAEELGVVFVGELVDIYVNRKEVPRIVH
ncbi:hypothetical protein OAA77_00890 [Gammaproteobacteria bacterium]|nr:hypothetical protein [Gammaproteobacteria bacterium]